MNKPSNDAKEIFKQLISIANVRRIKASMNPIIYDLADGSKKILSSLIELFFSYSRFAVLTALYSAISINASIDQVD